MTFIDGTVVNVALPALQAALNATITDVQWVVEAYALFLGALILVGGSMGDQFGRKRVFLFGVLFFTASSILCGLATSSRVLIVGGDRCCALAQVHGREQGSFAKPSNRLDRCIAGRARPGRHCLRIARVAASRSGSSLGDRFAFHRRAVSGVADRGGAPGA